jgi:hypothetical protein
MSGRQRAVGVAHLSPGGVADLVLTSQLREELQLGRYRDVGKVAPLALQQFDGLRGRAVAQEHSLIARWGACDTARPAGVGFLDG